MNLVSKWHFKFIYLFFKQEAQNYNGSLRQLINSALSFLLFPFILLSSKIKESGGGKQCQLLHKPK
jgi:hypothetical protein